jgi:hypothetical protein
VIVTPRGAKGQALADADPEHSADEFDDWLPGKGSDDATR